MQRGPLLALLALLALASALGDVTQLGDELGDRVAASLLPGVSGPVAKEQHEAKQDAVKTAAVSNAAAERTQEEAEVQHPAKVVDGSPLLHRAGAWRALCLGFFECGAHTAWASARIRRPRVVVAAAAVPDEELPLPPAPRLDLLAQSLLRHQRLQAENAAVQHASPASQTEQQLPADLGAACYAADGLVGRCEPLALCMGRVAATAAQGSCSGHTVCCVPSVPFAAAPAAAHEERHDSAEQPEDQRLAMRQRVLQEEQRQRQRQRVQEQRQRQRQHAVRVQHRPWYSWFARHHAAARESVPDLHRQAFSGEPSQAGALCSLFCGKLIACSLLCCAARGGAVRRAPASSRGRCCEAAARRRRRCRD